VEEEDRHQEEQGRTELMEGVSPGHAGQVEQTGDHQKLSGVNRDSGHCEQRHARAEQHQDFVPAGSRWTTESPGR